MPDADWDLRGRIVLPNGTMVGDELILAAGSNDEFAWANNVVFDGQYFLVVWTEFVGSPATGQGTVLGRYWTPDGVPVGTAFPVSAAQTGQLAVGLSTGAGKVLTLINTSAFNARRGCLREIHHQTLQRSSADRNAKSHRHLQRDPPIQHQSADVD